MRRSKDMIIIHELFTNSDLTYEELGKLMSGGKYRDPRASAHQFLNKTQDPTIGMLRKFAHAMDMNLISLVHKLEAK